MITRSIAQPPPTPSALVLTTPLLPESGMSSAIPNAFKIPHVLRRVLNSASDGTLATAARCSREWNSVALDCLWKDLDDIRPLLRLLSPLQQVDKNGDAVWEFEHQLVDVEWDRWMVHAPRVRTLEVDSQRIGPDGLCSLFDPSIVQSMLCSYSLGGPLLPNLKDLTWRISSDIGVLSVLPFLHSDLDSLKIDLKTSISEEATCRLLRLLPQRTPNLKTFAFLSRSPSSPFSKLLSKYLSSCKSLTSISLPQFYHTPDIVSITGQLPHLTSLGAEFLATQSHDERGMCFQILEGTFTALRVLDIEASFHAASIHLEPPNHFSSVTALCLSDRRYFKPSQITLFLTNLAASCTGIVTICLNLFTDGSVASPRVPFDALRPALGCPKVTRFEVAHDIPMTLTEQDVHDMAKAWPDLDTLRLSEDARTPKSAAAGAGVSMSMLPLFAEKLPKLQQLGLYFDMGKVPAYDGTLNTQTRFMHLNELFVGSSWVPSGKVSAVGFFLASFYARSPCIESFRSSWDWTGYPEDETERRAEWAQVQRVAELAVSYGEADRWKYERLAKVRGDLGKAVEAPKSKSTNGESPRSAPC